jgi:2-oxoisovalerate dehydrogenase E2 component (dihydrolipoyl transacylase)
MGTAAIKLTDIGEGIAEAEIVEWHVAVGDPVRQDDVVAAVTTDKATVEIPSPLSGTVTWLAGEIGDKIPVGADLVRLEVAADSPSEEATTARRPPTTPSRPPTTLAKEARNGEPAAEVEVSPPPLSRRDAATPTPSLAKPVAAPSVRKRARETGVNLQAVRGTGPAGRITHQDLDVFLAQGGSAGPPSGKRKNTSVKEIKIVGIRRKIAERMALAHARIPHITIIEEVDMTNLEDLREELNRPQGGTRSKLTVLPFLIQAIVVAVREQPRFNAHFDDTAGVVTEFGGVHVGIATQTPGGLMVPVVRHAEANSLWENARDIGRLATAARDGTAAQRELTGSTITITSLGPLGAIATTPIINHPELAIIGVNKLSLRPWWDGQHFVPRRMMNLSCSFDHRVIDGYDAAVFVQKLKSLLEKPAMLFVGLTDA